MTSDCHSRPAQGAFRQHRIKKLQRSFSAPADGANTKGFAILGLKRIIEALGDTVNIA